MTEPLTGREFVARLTAVGVVALGVWAGVVVAGRWSERLSYAGLPELRAADPSLVGAIRAGLRPQDHASFGEPLLPETLAAVLERDPSASGVALVRVLRDRHLKPSRVQRWGTALGDETQEPEAVWLREHPSPAADAALLRILRDASEPTSLRQIAVVALARPGDARAAEAFADVVCDDAEGPQFRIYTLLRVPRIGVVPRRMRDVLSSPWRRLALIAAGSLAAAGDPEAPSLVVAGLVKASRSDYEAELGWVSALGLRRLVTDDEDLARRLDELVTLAQRGRWRPLVDETERVARDAAGRLALDVAVWIGRHPELQETAFERERADYAASERRRRELATPAPAEIDGDRFDLATALLHGESADEVREYLERLDHVARLVRRDAGANPTPARWIDALNRRLLSAPRVLQMPAEPSELTYVMAVGYGNCMGLSSLYLCVADRLGLPIHAVAAPQHVFVRWDDGTTRRNIECTEGGTEYADAWYETRGDGLSIAAADVASGAYLANLSPSQVLSLSMINRASHLDARGWADRALESADIAVRLGPDEPLARVVRATVLLDLSRPRAADAHRDLVAAEGRRTLSDREAERVAALYLRTGDATAALRFADAAILRDPASRSARVLRARALGRTGRTLDAERELAAIAGPRADVHFARIELAMAAGGDEWRALLERVAPKPTREFGLHLQVAAALLGGSTGRVPSAADARFALDRISDLGALQGPGSPGAMSLFDLSGSFEEAVEKQQDTGSWRRTYYFLTAACCRLEGDEAGAAAAEAAAGGR